MSDINLESYSIIGQESQTLHIILRKNEKININKYYLISASSDELNENIYKNIDFISIPNTLKASDKNLKKVDSPEIVNLKNKNENIEYISLGKGGKIMTIIPSFYNNLYIRLDSLLAFNNGIELYTDNELDKELNKILRNNFFNYNFDRFFQRNRNYLFLTNFETKKQFCLIKTKLNNEIEEDNFNNLAHSFLFNKNNSINDFVFISGKNNLFEKRLGDGESMILLGQSLIAFEGSITFRQIKSKDKYYKYVNEVNDIIIDGPGLIIFEQCERIVPMTNNHYAMIALLILILITQFIIQLLIYYKI